MNNLAMSEQFVPPVPLNQVYDSIDKTKFLIESFNTIKTEFESFSESIEGGTEVKSLFFQTSTTTFTCQVINKSDRSSSEAFVVVSMSNGVNGAANLSFDFSEVDHSARKNFNFSVATEDDQLLLKEQFLFESSSYRIGTATQLASDMQRHLLKLAGIT